MLFFLSLCHVMTCCCVILMTDQPHHNLPKLKQPSFNCPDSPFLNQCHLLATMAWLFLVALHCCPPHKSLGITCWETSKNYIIFHTQSGGLQ